MLFDEDNGYTLKYSYGIYFGEISGKCAKGEKQEEIEQKVENLGLIESIESDDFVGSRILHQSRIASSPR